MKIDIRPALRTGGSLVLGALSNPEIGARLFLSTRTVQYHLGKVFKIGRASCRERVSIDV